MEIKQYPGFPNSLIIRFFTRSTKVSEEWCLPWARQGYRAPPPPTSRTVRDLSFFFSENILPEPTPPADPNPDPKYIACMAKLIRLSQSKSCDLDPCPARMVKDSADIPAGSITTIINLSLSECPDAFPDWDTLKQVPKFRSSQVPGTSSSQFSSSGNFKFRNKKGKKPCFFLFKKTNILDTAFCLPTHYSIAKLRAGMELNMFF